MRHIRAAGHKIHATVGKVTLTALTAASQEADKVFDHLAYHPPARSPQDLLAMGHDFMHNFSETTLHSRGTELGMWVRPPKSGDETKPVYVVFHGRRGNWGRPGVYDPRMSLQEENPHRMEWLKEIAATGAGIIAVHTRCHGTSRHHGNRDISERHFKHDIEAVADYLQKQHIPSNRLIVAGESMGGALAAMLAEELTHRGQPPAVLGLMTTFASMTDMIRMHLQEAKIGGIRIGRLFDALSAEDVATLIDNKLNTAKRIRTLNPKHTSLYIANVKDDEHIPQHQHEKLLKAAANAGFVAGSEHCRISEWTEADLWARAQDRHTGSDYKKVVENLQALYEARQSHKVNGHAGNGHAGNGWVSHALNTVERNGLSVQQK